MDSIPRPGGGDFETMRAAIAKGLQQEHVWPDRHYEKVRVNRCFHFKREK